MKKKYKRKYLIDRKYQFSEAILVVIANILSVLLASTLIMWLYLIVWDGSIAVNHNQKITQYITASLLVVVILSVYFSVLRSRSVAGMMKKLRRILTDAGHGIFPAKTTVFRKSDYFKDIATPLDECLDQLKKKQIVDNSETIRSLEELVEGIEKDEIPAAGIRRPLMDIIAKLKN